MNNEKSILIPEELAIKEPDLELLNIINNKAFDDKVLFETNSNFHNIKIIKNEIGKFLHYSDTYQAGFIDTDFYKGNLPYINYFLITYLLNPEVKNILLIGLGSGKIVNDFEKIFDNLKNIDVVDIEENILDIAINYFNFSPSEKFNFILQDGLTYLRNNKKKYDLIVVDVANNDGIDLRFLSQEYFGSVKNSLSKNGIFVSNMCASPDFENSQNIFFNEYFPIYTKNFKYNRVFKCDYSDKVYYKSFFNIDKRVIDITNIIIISSNKEYELNTNSKKLESLNVEISHYLQDLYKIFKS